MFFFLETYFRPCCLRSSTRPTPQHCNEGVGGVGRQSCEENITFFYGGGCSISNNDLRHHFWHLHCTDHVHCSPPLLLTPCHSELGPSALQLEDAPWTPWHPGIKATLDPNMHWTQNRPGLKVSMDSWAPWTWGRLGLEITMNNHSPASGEEADDHAVRKFMKDVKDAMKDTSKSCIWWGESLKTLTL